MFIDPKIVTVCEWLRNEMGKPIKINDWALGGSYNYSGYRPPDCTIGAKYSQHKMGRAADIKIEGVEPKRVFEFIKENFSELSKMGLTTMEDSNYTTSWTHIDTRWHSGKDLLIVKP